MVGINNAKGIAQIASALNPKLVNMPTLDIAGAVNNYYQAKDKAEQKKLAEDQRYKAQLYSDALASGDQDTINSAWANYDPDGYAKYMQNKEATQTAFDNDMAKLAQHNQYAVGLENLRNNNALGLAKYRMDIANQNALDERARNDALLADKDNIAKSMLANGDISQSQYDLWRLTGNENVLGVSNGGKETQIQKEQAKRDMNKQDFEESKPNVINAMQRGYSAAQSGWGLGGIGGTSFNPAGWFGKKSNQNRADIESANTQMNTILRKQLASTGLTGSELNSAVEAQAYRYTISPSDNEENIKQKMRNFAVDVLGENPSVLEKEKQEKSLPTGTYKTSSGNVIRSVE